MMIIVKNPTIINKTELSSDSKFSDLLKGTITEVTAKDLEGITSIRYGTFYNCTSLTSITIPDSVTSIGKDAFYGCSGLTNFIFPDSIKSIGENGFRGAFGEEICIYLKGDVSIGNNAFYGCKNLIKFKGYGTKTKTLNSYGLSSCSNLKKLEFNEGFTTFGSLAINGVTGCNTIVLPSTTTTLQANWVQYTNIPKLICKATTPPTMASVSGTRGNNFVPLESIEQYKTATNWSSYPNTYPFVKTESDLSTIDTTVYTKACVEGNELGIEDDNNYPIYNYINGEWVKEI